jgi:hypothetical protein
MGALNTAAKLINGLLAIAESSGNSSHKSEPTAKAPAATAAAQQLVADTQMAGKGLSHQAQQVAAQAQQAAAGAVDDVDTIVADMQGEPLSTSCTICYVLQEAVCAGSNHCGDSHGDVVTAGKSRAGQSRARQSRAEQSRAEMHPCWGERRLSTP